MRPALQLLGLDVTDIGASHYVAMLSDGRKIFQFYNDLLAGDPLFSNEALIPNLVVVGSVVIRSIVVVVYPIDTWLLFVTFCKF